MAKGKVTINEEICKGCEMCITACPVHIMQLNEGKINSKGYHPAMVKDMDRCIGCANCALIYPDVAITVERLDIKK